ASSLMVSVRRAPDFLFAPSGLMFRPPFTESVPPHCELVPLTAVRPAGRVSVNPTPVSATVVFGLVIVNDSVVVWLSGTVAAPNAFDIVGAASTVRVAVLLVAPVPVSVALTAPVVLFLTPAVAPV